MKSHLIASAVLASSIAASAFAAPIVSEPFDYTVGSALDNQNGGTGFTAAWNAPDTNGPLVVSGLDVSPYQSESGAAAQLSVSSTATYRSFDNTSLTGVRWFSLIFDAADTGNNAGIRVVFESSANSTTTGYGINIDTTTSTGPILNTVIYARGQTSAGTGVTITNRDPVLIIGKFDPAGGTVGSATLYINPTDISSEAQLAATAFGTSTVSPTALTLGNNISLRGGVGAQVVDEMRLGLSLADVAAIPEPASLGLLGLGGLALGRRRRNA